MEKHRKNQDGLHQKLNQRIIPHKIRCLIKWAVLPKHGKHVDRKMHQQENQQEHC